MKDRRRAIFRRSGQRVEPRPAPQRHAPPRPTTPLPGGRSLPVSGAASHVSNSALYARGQRQYRAAAADTTAGSRSVAGAGHRVPKGESKVGQRVGISPTFSVRPSVPPHRASFPGTGGSRYFKGNVITNGLSTPQNPGTVGLVRALNGHRGPFKR